MIRISNKHPRVNILNPGPGVGGHCISVDPWFLVGDYPEQTHLIHQARKTNDSMPAYVLERIKEIMTEKGIKTFDKVGLYGLTYKENVDDVRESPTLQLLDILEGQEKDMKVYDPFISTVMVDNQYNNFESFKNDIEMIVVMVGHNNIHNEDLSDLVIFDTKNVIANSKTFKL